MKKTAQTILAKAEPDSGKKPKTVAVAIKAETTSKPSANSDANREPEAEPWLRT